jgi:hypothetical protein
MNMDHAQVMHYGKVAVVVGGIGLVAYVLYSRLSAASSSSASADTTSADAATSDAAFSALSTGVSTSGAYAGVGSYSSGSDSSGNTSASSDAATPTSPAASVMDYATILAGLFSGATNATAQQQTAAASNNAAVVSAINTVAPTPAPQPAVTQPTYTPPTPAAPTPQATPDTSQFSESVNGMLTYNPTLYATDAAYRADWNQGASNNVAAFGSNWNSVAAGANQTVLNQGLANAYQGYVQNQTAIH